MPGQAARARRPVTSRQRGRSARRTRRVDRASTRDTLAHETDDRTCRLRRHTRHDGVLPSGGGNERRSVAVSLAKLACSYRPHAATTRPTGMSVYSGPVSAASPPGGRKREGPSPGWAETAPAGSGRRSRLGPGPTGTRPPREPASTAWSVEWPASRTGHRTDSPCPRIPRQVARRIARREGRERAGCEVDGGSRDEFGDVAENAAPPASCGQRMIASAASRVRARRQPGALPALDPASANRCSLRRRTRPSPPSGHAVSRTGRCAGRQPPPGRC